MADPCLVTWGRTRIPGGGEVELTALRFGEGAPRQILVAGLHGDEPTAIYALRTFVEHHVHSLPGAIDVVPAVNWAGLLLGHRRFPFGGVDLNRVLLPQVANQYARETIEALVDFCRGADLVVDLHNWDSPTILMGISHRYGETPASASLDALARFGCEYIWIPENESYTAGTLGYALSEIGVCHCAIELRPAWLSETTDIQRYANALERMLSGTTADGVPGPQWPPRGGRVAVTSDEAGLFLPRAAPGEALEKGQPCGDILDARSLRIVASPRSPAAGVVLQIESRRSVFPGQMLAFVGTLTEDGPKGTTAT